MNGLERIFSAVQGTRPDRQPFTLLLPLVGANLVKANTKDFYTNPALCFEGLSAAVELFDPDIVIGPFSIALEAAAFGSELVFLDKYAPNIRKPVLPDISKIDSLLVPGFSEPSLNFKLRANELIAAKYQGNKAIATAMASPADLPAVLMGIENWIDALLFHPAEVDKIMKKMVGFFVEAGNELLAKGTTFLVITVNFTTAPIVSEKIFNMLLPYLHEAFQQIKGPLVVHHGGTKLTPNFDKYAALPNVAALVLGPTESFEKAREIAGNNIVLMGNANGPDYINLTPEQAAAGTLKILNNRKADKHFIFATSNADIPYDTPFEVIKEVADTIKNFRKEYE